MSAKRKFSRLLDSFTDSDRIDDRKVSLPKKIAQLHVRSRGKEALAHSTYSPWSRELFLQRLRSYAFSNWTVPSHLSRCNAIACTSHGWKALPVDGTTEKNTIQCVHCLSIICIKLGDNEDLYPKLEVNYGDMIDSRAHSLSCPWRQKAANASAVYSDLSINSAQQSALQARKLSWDVLPEISQGKRLSLPLEYDPKIINDKDPREFVPDGTFLAVLGWQLESIPSLDPHSVSANLLVSCDLCFRKFLMDGPIDLVKQHMSYCPYVQKTSTGSRQWVKLLEYQVTMPTSGNQLTKSMSNSSSPFSSTNDLSTDEERQSRLGRLKSIYFKRRRRE